MNAMRRELAGMLEEAGTRRPAALRRSLSEGYLYATDLPAAAENGTEAFRRRAEEAGWQCEEEGGWLQMTREAPDPPEGWYDGPFGTEAACCASLLARHPGTAESGREQRMLIKAGEEGPEAYENACRRLHAEWAERLRRKADLPGIGRGYFGGEENAV